MKVAYVFNTPRAAAYKVQKMILPQLEAGTHGVEVVGMFFFDDNVWALRKGDKSIGFNCKYIVLIIVFKYNVFHRANCIIGCAAGCTECGKVVLSLEILKIILNF
jgi:hypothetical protein